MTPTNDAPVTVEQCPFCGGRAQLDRYDPDPANPEMAVNCMGECDGIFIFPKIAAGDTPALVQRWNTRLAALASAPATSLPAGRDLLSEALDALQPFADADERQEEDKDWQQCWPTLTVGDLRKARSVINAAATASAPAGDGVEAAIAEVDRILDGIDAQETDREEGWWETSIGANFGAGKLAEIKTLVAALGRPRAAVGEREERDHVDREHLQQVADGAFGDGPFTRGAARDQLAALQSPPAKVEGV